LSTFFFEDRALFWNLDLFLCLKKFFSLLLSLLLAIAVKKLLGATGVFWLQEESLKFFLLSEETLFFLFEVSEFSLLLACLLACNERKVKKL
jgi:hypothetical protein